MPKETLNKSTPKRAQTGTHPSPAAVEDCFGLVDSMQCFPFRIYLIYTKFGKNL